MAVLVPEQPVRLLGIEILVLGVFWVFRTLRVTREYSADMRAMDRPGKVDWRIEWPAWIAWVVALSAAGLALVAERGDIGLPILALAMVGMFSFAIWSAWVLVSEVKD
jgi:hypothetical protein